jgi:succinate-semialdehyde dehydrogenase/glutarate-semialdehyde dehydrogenase
MPGNIQTEHDPMSNTIAVRNPWTGAIDLQLEEPSAQWLSDECTRLRTNQTEWAALSVTARVKALSQFGQAMADHRDAIIASLEEDTGRTRIAQIEFELLRRAIERTCNFAPELVKESDELDTEQEHISAFQQKVPYGLMLNIAPWNFPLLLSLLDVFPALAVGNAAIVKPSEVTPRWVGPVQKALAEVPELEAVLSFAIGSGETGAALINQADIVSFTGSVATGRKVAEAAAAKFIPVFLELGGNDPAIVMKSADIQAAAEEIIRSSASASGQACQSLERIYVDEAIADEFIEVITAKARGITLNTVDRADGFIGPFIFKPQPAKIKEQLDDAVAKGATIVAGGNLIEQGGIWLEATVVVDVNHNMALMTEETFGPVVPIMKFATETEAIQLANDTHYGLSASVFAGTTEEGARLSRHINAGAVSVNAASLTARVHRVPHESFNLSGMGRSRFGDEALLRYLRTKAIFEQH